MPKYFVIHGSVGLPKEQSAKVGDSLELTVEQAADLVKAGTVADEKTFAGLKKMVEGAIDSDSLAGLDKKHQKLATGLRAGGKLDAKPEPKK